MSDAYPEIPDINRSRLTARMANISPIMRSQLGYSSVGKKVKVQLNMDLEGLTYIADANEENKRKSKNSSPAGKSKKS